MIEALAVGARALGVLASAHLIGAPLFLALAGAVPALSDWNRALRRTLPVAAGALLVALGAALVAQAATVAGTFAGASELLHSLARDTAYGRIWISRVGLSVVLLLLALLALRTPRVLPLVAVLAAVVAALAARSGHAAGSEDPTLLISLHMLHLLALSAWFGGLWPWMRLARSATPAGLDSVARTLRRFSRLAAACMAAIVLSGSALAWTFIEDQGDLLGTRYGQLLCLKLGLLAAVLGIANALRRHWLPGLGSESGSASLLDGARSVRREWGLGLGVLTLGAALAQTPPAIHDQPRWWLPFRISVDASQEDPASGNAILIGLVLLAVGVLALLFTRRRWASGLLVSGGAASALWGLAVTAYPDTFLRAPVPYLTLSIAQGRDSFQTYCVSCHGAGGLGDGVLAPALAKPPADLSEPHTALHTPGDMYWWFTHGIQDSPMPGFAEVLDEEQRWDLVNFLTAFSQGYQARVLGPQIVPRGPWLGAPNFYYATTDGGRAELKDLRRQRAVLLVFADTDPRSAARLAAARALDGPALAVLVPAEPDIWQAYQLLTRTRADRGAPDQLDMPRRHAEFLIDRFGYVRARWVPADDGWDDSFDVPAQVQVLAAEPEILPPPDLHLH